MLHWNYERCCYSPPVFLDFRRESFPPFAKIPLSPYFPQPSIPWLQSKLIIADGHARVIISMGTSSLREPPSACPSLIQEIAILPSTGSIRFIARPATDTNHLINRYRSLLKFLLARSRNVLLDDFFVCSFLGQFQVAVGDSFFYILFGSEEESGESADSNAQWESKQGTWMMYLPSKRFPPVQNFCVTWSLFVCLRWNTALCFRGCTRCCLRIHDDGISCTLY